MWSLFALKGYLHLQSFMIKTEKKEWLNPGLFGPQKSGGSGGRSKGGGRLRGSTVFSKTYLSDERVI